MAEIVLSREEAMWRIIDKSRQKVSGMHDLPKAVGEEIHTSVSTEPFASACNVSGKLNDLKHRHQIRWKREDGTRVHYIVVGCNSYPRKKV